MTPTPLRLGAGLLTAAAAVAFALAAPANAAEPPSAPAPVIGASSGQNYIVVFKENTGQSSVKVNSLVRSAQAEAVDQGADITHRFTTVLDGFAGRLTPKALRTLRKNPDVAFIEADQKVSISASGIESPATWGLDRIDQRTIPLDGSYRYATSGAGVTAYIIDSGIRASHAEFSGRVTAGHSSINDGRGTGDCNGHGTHVAGTVGGETYGVAQDVRLVPVRVLDCSGSGAWSGVIAGIDWVTRDHVAGAPAVANMSLGGGASTAVDNAVRNSIADGVTYAAAAGNESGSNACNVSPARVTQALTVGSTTSTDARSSFSNIGSCLDIFAPGSSITSAWTTGDRATNSISGTSMASPHVAGAAALHLEANPSASPAAVGNALTSQATPDVVKNAGSGSPNRLLHVGSTTTPTPGVCDDYAEVVTGSLAQGRSVHHPGNQGYFHSRAGTHRGCLSAPAGTDFDLYLHRWNGSNWVVVARSTSPSPSERITHNGSAGYYSWRVVADSGSGTYTLGFDRP